MRKNPEIVTFLAITGLCAAAVFLTGLAVDNAFLRLLSKPIIPAVILTWVLITRQDRYARWIAVALGCCLVGDILLEASAFLFLPGLAAFLIGQILFTVAFLQASRKPAIYLLIPVGIWFALVYWVIFPDLGAMAFPVAAYMVVIGVMVWRAAARVGISGDIHWSEWAGLIGAFLFAFSDSLIAIDKFYSSMAAAKYVSIVAYWISLLLLAVTILRKPVQSME